MGEPMDVLWDEVAGKLKEAGLDVQLPDMRTMDTSQLKVICIPVGLGESLRQMGEEDRDQVVMVRVDHKTKDFLDAWVESGAVSSRSEAAALFIREGLALRAQELEKLEHALEDVRQAKERLQAEARKVLRSDGGEQQSPADASAGKA